MTLFPSKTKCCQVCQFFVRFCCAFNHLLLSLHRDLRGGIHLGIDTWDVLSFTLGSHGLNHSTMFTFQEGLHEKTFALKSALRLKKWSFFSRRFRKLKCKMIKDDEQWRENPWFEDECSQNWWLNQLHKFAVFVIAFPESFTPSTEIFTWVVVPIMVCVGLLSCGAMVLVVTAVSVVATVFTVASIGSGTTVSAVPSCETMVGVAEGAP